MRFTIGGRGFDITREEVALAIRREPPKSFDGRNKYYVEINGQKYPPKQLIHLVTGLAYTEDFHSQEARRILGRLGFTVRELPQTYTYESESYTVKTGADDGVRKFAVTLRQGEDGYIIVSCPALPGCYSQGRTEEEAVANIREAIRGYIASMRQHGEEIPAIMKVREIEVPA